MTRSFSAEAQRTLDTVRVTPTQLREADCVDGHKCWIAVNGVVYDIAGSSKWNSGQHYGVTAGTDATEQFVDSGHAAAKLNDLPVVGTLDQ
ncbi:MAG: cytochrome b5 domain-containing protein [Dermatophilus congolensis]|nr:cytochrome b5 domain-containing protein [Dermatophilus congolensis]